MKTVSTWHLLPNGDQSAFVVFSHNADVDERALTPPPSEVVCRERTPSLVIGESHRHHVLLLSSDQDSDLTADSILSPRVSLLADPDLQYILRKSYSCDNLSEPPSDNSFGVVNNVFVSVMVFIHPFSLVC